MQATIAGTLVVDLLPRYAGPVRNEADGPVPSERPVAVSVVGWAWVVGGTMMPLAQILGALWVRGQGGSGTLKGIIVGFVFMAAIGVIPVALVLGVVMVGIGRGVLARSGAAWTGAMILAVLMTLLVVAGAPELDRDLQRGHGELLGFFHYCPSVPLFAAMGPPTLLILGLHRRWFRRPSSPGTPAGRA